MFRLSGPGGPRPAYRLLATLYSVHIVVCRAAQSPSIGVVPRLGALYLCAVCYVLCARHI
eukprot:scaffold36273_cov150-Isochrysis_galbana.AAC.2